MRPEDAAPRENGGPIEKTVDHALNDTDSLGTGGRHHAETLAESDSPLAGPDTTPHSVEQFVELLSNSGLISSDELNSFMEQCADGSSRPADVDVLTRALLEKQKLTPFQLEQLQAGKFKNLVLGNYVILEKLGAGGMGVVFKARHRRMKRDVAVKVLPEAMTRSPDALARFHREVEAAAKLQHPNIAAAFDADDAEGVHFLVMEYVDGPDLSRFVKQDGPLPLRYAVALMVQAGRGLQHAHDEGVVHRDIKPGNLLVDPRGTLKILDMGLAHVLTEPDADGMNPTELTQSGRVMGTVDYMAPEQAKDAKRADHRADVYSLGCTLFYLATGRPLSPEGSITEKLLWHQAEVIPALSESVPASTAALDAVLSKMLAKQPEDRQQSMNEVTQQLAICLEELAGRPEADQPVTTGPLANVSLRDSVTGSTVDGNTVTMLVSALKQHKKRAAWKKFAVAAVAAAGLLLLMVLFLSPTHDNGTPGSDQGNDHRAGDGGQAAVVAGADQQQRQRLKWIFDHQGNLTIVTAAGLVPHAVRRVTDLPLEAFDVRGVKLSGASVGDDEIKRLVELKGLQDLALAKTAVTDDGLEVVGKLATVWTLDLAQTGIGDAGLKRLTGLSELRDLNLSGTQVTDSGLAALADLPHLEKLYLADTQITDAALNNLTQIAGLRYISLRGTGVTADGLFVLDRAPSQPQVDWDGPNPEQSAARKLVGSRATITVELSRDPAPIKVSRTADLPAGRFRVKAVDFSNNPRITDGDLAALADLKHIEQLALDGTAVTEKGLTSLASLASLTSVDLGSLQISQAAVGQLKQALPGCEVLQQLTDRWKSTQWALASGASVSMQLPDGQMLYDVTDAQQVPRGPFLLRSVRFDKGAEVGDDDLAHFRGLNKLETLQLAGAKLSDAGLGHLLGCTSLRDLDLSGTQLTDQGVITLSRLGGLRQLHVAGTKITGASVRQLMELPELTHLNLADTAIGDDDLVDLKGYAKLSWLSLSGTACTDAAIDRLSRLAGLRQLMIDRTSLTDAGVEQLQSVLSRCTVTGNPPDRQRQALRWVLLRGGVAEIADGDGAVAVEKSSQLPRGACRVLKIDLSVLGDRVGDEGLAPLAACTDLIELNLNETDVDNEALAVAASMPQLQKLRLAQTRISDTGLAALAGLSELREIELSGTRISDRGLQQLSGLGHIEKLVLDNCRLTDGALAHLQPHRGLRSLSMNYNRDLTDAAVEQMAGFAQLDRLELAGTAITDDALAAIAAHAGLRRLDLSSTKITDAGVARLSALTRLVYLRLNSTEVGDSALAALARIATLRYVDALRTRATEDGAASLRRGNDQLQILVSARRRDPRQDGRNPGQSPPQQPPGAPGPFRGR